MTVKLVFLGEQTNYYTFTAESLQEALQKMRQLGDRDGDGNHAASIDIRADIFQNLQTGIVPGSTYQIQGMGWTATALITQGSLYYGFVYRFPYWSNVESLSKPIQSEWQRYTKCLWIHERGHADEAIPIFQRYQKQFQNLRIAQMGSSDKEAEEAAQKELRVQVREIFNLLSYEIKKSIISYDDKTCHGRTQGAKLKTSIQKGSKH
jgi:hypothetical protein